MLKLYRYCHYLFWLLFAHAVADCLLQPPWIAKFKTIGVANDIHPLYPFFILLAHGIINGGVYALASGLVCVGVLEFVFHSYIDLGSTTGVFGLVVDQALHLACILLYAGICVRYRG